MKNVLLTLLCLLISVLCFSQDSYPKLIQLPNNDTGVVITKGQMDALYKFKIEYERNLSKMAAMNRVLDSCIIAIPIIKSQVVDLKSVISAKDLQIATRDKTLTDYADVLQHREKQIIRLKWQKVFIGVVGCITTGIMTYAYFNKH